MPTEVFLKLTKSKKEELTKLGFEAFSKKHYRDTSINDLAKSFGMTRTAFYYYFSGKEDLYQYLVTLKKNEFVNSYIYNKECKLELFDLFTLLFEYLATFKESNIQAFFLDLFYNIDFDLQNTLLLQLLGRETYEDFSHFEGFSKYKMTSKEEIKEVVNLLFAIVYHETLFYYNNNISLDIAKQNLKTKMDYMKYGILKKEGNNNE